MEKRIKVVIVIAIFIGCYSSEMTNNKTYKKSNTLKKDSNIVYKAKDTIIIAKDIKAGSKILNSICVNGSYKIEGDSSYIKTTLVDIITGVEKQWVSSSFVGALGSTHFIYKKNGNLHQTMFLQYKDRVFTGYFTEGGKQGVNVKLFTQEVYEELFGTTGVETFINFDENYIVCVVQMDIVKYTEDGSSFQSLLFTKLDNFSKTKEIEFDMEKTNINYFFPNINDTLNALKVSYTLDSLYNTLKW